MKTARNRSIFAFNGTLFGVGVALIASAGARATATEALESQLARCATIAARDDRLACYDALAAAPPSTADGGVAAAASVPLSAPAAAVPPAPPPPPAPAPAPPPAEAERPEEFGLSPIQRGVKEHRIASIRARVAGFARGPSGSVLVVLDNGQSWELDAADPLLAAGDAVTIRRAALGSFLLITSTKRSHRVRRIH